MVAPETGEAPSVGHPDRSPDGRRIVHVTGDGPSVVDAADGRKRQVLTSPPVIPTDRLSE
ncbi:hypothetical protein [Streptomyces sp. NPDC058632]|uniref:hypothetical protein n=1 Tax=unclassified Streptomyces TaxID=2593676 RepID=UPI00365797E0